MKIPGYRLHRKLGAGGMAAVYLATQEAFDRKVALKVIATRSFENAAAAERFVQEARTVAKFSHPHIVPVYDVGQVGPVHYLAMDYLRGGKLSEWIQAGLQPEEAAQIAEQIALALHYAHGKGYAHRDVKPDNILFREDNSAVLTDFGIAKSLRTDTDMTQAGIVMGTPRYMAPEQARGRNVDGRADLYALGVILYQMLTRRLPYEATEPLALAMQHTQAPIPRLPAELAEFQAIIDRLLAKSPDQRFQNGLELIKALKHRQQPQVARISAAALTLAEHAAEQDTPKNLEVTEQCRRHWLLWKRYGLDCRLRAEEYQQFSVLFSSLTSRLLAWHDERGDSARELKLEFSIDPALQHRAEQAVALLYEEGDAFAFLAKLKVTLTLRDLEGRLLSESQPGAAPLASAA